jgi:subtilase family serine protease
MRTLVIVALALLVAPFVLAQTPLENRILTAVSNSELRQLSGNVPPLARAQFDRGKAPDSIVLPRMTMFFELSAGQQAALDQILAEQQDRSSSNYHHWLTPEEFGGRFGLSQNDISKVIAWLESRGFVVLEVPASRNAVSFAGTAAQVASAFATEIHRYVLNGEERYANSSEPSLPAALVGVVSGLTGLTDFRPKPSVIRRVIPRARPQLTTGQGGHFLAPDDFASIYDVKPLYGRGIDGTGQKIAVVGQSDIQLGDIREFRSLMGLAANDPQIVLVPSAADPGMHDDDLEEADLDLEWSGAVAKNAALIYVNSTNAWDSLRFAVTNDIAPIISVSYSVCEPLVAASDVQSFIAIGRQANAQGQTIVASSGDSGAAACDDPYALAATQGLAVNAPASLPYVTAVGGTKFNEGSGTFWSATNNANRGSALSYIPEMAWNDSGSGSGIEASGGGASALFSKPLWQSGAGVPGDGVRDVPDVAFSGSAAHDAYLICDESFDSMTKLFTPVCPAGSFGGFDAVGGTSAGTPAFAGILALLNQATNSAQGNINYTLYPLAGVSAHSFHDIAGGSNAVPCQTTPQSPDCPMSGTGAGFLGYSAGAGYDMATGLGSVDASELINAWTSVTSSPDFDISVSPPSITLNRGAIATAQITVTNVGGMQGVPSLGCQVPAIFVGITCSVANAGPNSFRLILASSTNAAFVSIAASRNSYWLAACLLLAGIFTLGCARRTDSGKTRLVPLFASACTIAALLMGCAGATSSGHLGTAQLQDAPVSIQLTPKNAFLGANGQQQFTAIVSNSTNAAVNWSVSPALGGISPMANSAGAAGGVYIAPSTFGANQSVIITATSAADPTKQASANILLVPPESGAIQVTGSMNGMSHTVGISLKVN